MPVKGPLPPVAVPSVFIPLREATRIEMWHLRPLFGNKAPTAAGIAAPNASNVVPFLTIVGVRGHYPDVNSWNGNSPSVVVGGGRRGCDAAKVRE